MVWVGVSAADVARRYVGGTIRNNDRNVLRSVVIMRKGSVHTDRPSKAMVSDARLKLVKDLERIEDVTLEWHLESGKPRAVSWRRPAMRWIVPER